MPDFEFLDCVDGGTNVIDEWLRQQPDGVRARFFGLFEYLANIPIGQWRMPKTRMLRGPFRQLREFRVKHERIKYRLVGFHGPNPSQVTLCAGLTHSQNQAAQREAMRRALRRGERVVRREAEGVAHVV